MGWLLSHGLISGSFTGFGSAIVAWNKDSLVKGRLSKETLPNLYLKLVYILPPSSAAYAALFVGQRCQR
jgi:hypothetical protein